MSKNNQKTIKDNIELSGIGLHNGLKSIWKLNLQVKIVE